MAQKKKRLSWALFCLTVLHFVLLSFESAATWYVIEWVSSHSETVFSLCCEIKKLCVLFEFENW